MNQGEGERQFASHGNYKGSDTDDLCETDAGTEGKAVKESTALCKPMTDTQETDHEVTKHKKFFLRW